MAPKKAASKKVAPNKTEKALVKYLETSARYSESHLVREAAEVALIELGAKKATSDDAATVDEGESHD